MIRRESSVPLRRQLGGIAVLAMVCCWSVFANSHAARAADATTQPAQTSTTGLRGYPVNAVARELQYEHMLNASPNAATALRDERALSGHVHRMGQPADYRTAVYMRDRLAAEGWDARIVTYIVPIAWPVQQQLEIVAPYHRTIDLYEPALPGDPWSADHAAVGKPYSGYSADGDVTGPLVFAYHGNRADYARLARMHVNVRGAIVFVRSGGGLSNTRKAVLAARMGAKAVFQFPEPFVDVFYPNLHGKAYPQGPNRPMGAALRNELLGLVEEAGDPTVDGVPLPGAKHRPFSTIQVPAIPFSTVTPLVAQQLLRALDGPAAPRSWKTNVARNFHTGRSVRAHFILKSRRFFGPIWDVIASMRGAVEPNESIVIGGHRDAWTYGAIDPGSGSVDLLQVGDALGKLRHAGWRPYRSIIIGSWDGEELNFFGSDAWARQNEKELKRGCWAYINTDEVTTGLRFEPYATDDLVGLIHSVSAVAIAPNGKTVTDYWHAQDKKLFVEAPGTGSDHEEFIYHEGIPSVGYIYSGIFGTWHSAYDNIASLKVFDPRMQLANASARITGVTALRLADAPFPDVNLSDLTVALQRRLNAFANARGKEERRTAVVRALQPYLMLFRALADGIEAQVARASTENDVASLHDWEKFCLLYRAPFYSQRGIAGDKWQRSLLYDSDDTTSLLPTLEATLDARHGAAALQQLTNAFAQIPHVVYLLNEMSDGEAH